MKQLLITPRMSEKGFNQSQNSTYVFNVPDTANKQEVAAGVSEQYGVTVTTVNVIRQKGKKVRAYRGRGKFANGTRVDTKKAYVRLKAGDKITVFEEEAK
ncbi:MAG TPA: 50S ribosomal protein L23 [Candidatus Saccharimonadales bacterium]